MYHGGKSGEKGGESCEKSKKEPCGQRIGWTAAGILWWMGCDDGSDAELFRNEILNLIQLDLQSGGQLAKE